MPEVYDECLGSALFAPYASLVATVAARLAPRRVLELAAGTGILTAELLRALPAAEITATDLNPAMVTRGAARVPGPDWRQADAQQLKLSDDCFDLVACQFGVMFFPDKPTAFAETARVLRPGGHALFTTWDTVDTSELPAAMVDSLQAVLPEDPPRFIERIPHGYVDAGQITADLRAGGLTDIGIERVVLHGRGDRPRVLPGHPAALRVGRTRVAGRADPATGCGDDFPAGPRPGGRRAGGVPGHRPRAGLTRGADRKGR